MKTRRNHRSALLALSIYISASHGYKIGDAVGILLRTQTSSHGSDILDVYRHQMPRFGISTKTRLDALFLLNGDETITEHMVSEEHKPLNKIQEMKLLEDYDSEHLRLSISFDEGFHHISWLDVYKPSLKHNQILENLRIKFIFSESDGSIHAIHREVKYRDMQLTHKKSGMPESFGVEYIWIEEGDVDIQGGVLALFLMVLILPLMRIVSFCFHYETLRDDGMIKTKHFLDISSSSEGFSKDV